MTADKYAKWLHHANPAIIANTLICLIHQANFLLDHQIAGLERQFIEEGGYSEMLHAARLKERERQSSSSSQGEHTCPEIQMTCPVCGKPMVIRTARKGVNAGSQFLGCSGYPECRQTCRFDSSP